MGNSRRAALAALACGSEKLKEQTPEPSDPSNARNSGREQQQEQQLGQQQEQQLGQQQDQRREQQQQDQQQDQQEQQREQQQQRRPEQQQQQPRNCLLTQLRKTKICRYHLMGACQYGSSCAFAHSCFELQTTPDLRKTRLCQAFEEGSCDDAACTFAHGEAELRSTNFFYKKSLCIWNQKGKCRNGEQCRFAHGSAELRTSQATLAMPPGLEMDSTSPTANRRRRRGGARGGSATPVPFVEPMKVRPIGVPARPQDEQGCTALDPAAMPFMPDAMALEAHGDTDAWCQWPGMIPMGLTGPPTMDNSYEIQANLEQLRAEVAALAQKCNELQMLVPGADVGQELSDIFEKTGFDFGQAMLEPGVRG